MWIWILTIGVVLLAIAICFSSKKVREDFSDTFSLLFYNTKRAKRKREEKLEREKQEYREKMEQRRIELEKSRIACEKQKEIQAKERAKREAEAERIRVENEERRRRNAELARKRKENISPFTNEKIMSALQKLDEITAITAYKLSVNYERTPDLFSTKLGGVPYWSTDMEYPTTENGTPLAMLAQFNLSDLESNDILPQSGMLQFFVDASLKKTSHRVVYHSKIDDSVTLESVLSLGVPLNKEFSLDVRKTSVSMGRSDYRFSEQFNIAAKQAGLTLPADAPENATLFSEAYACFPDTFDERCEFNKGSWLLGYPHFAQEDLRYQERYQHYDTSLFQLDSIRNPKTRDYDILWGDGGVGNFFINGEDLKKHDFSNTLFSTDCY